MRLAGGEFCGQGAEVELDVRRRSGRQRAREHAALLDADRERAAPEQKPFQADTKSPPQGTQVIVGCDRLAALEHDAGL